MAVASTTNNPHETIRSWHGRIHTRARQDQRRQKDGERGVTSIERHKVMPIREIKILAPITTTRKENVAISKPISILVRFSFTVCSFPSLVPLLPVLSLSRSPFRFLTVANLCRSNSIFSFSSLIFSCSCRYSDSRFSYNPFISRIDVFTDSNSFCFSVNLWYCSLRKRSSWERRVNSFCCSVSRSCERRAC